MRIRASIFLGLGLLVLTGCQVGPRHCLPCVEMDDRWHSVKGDAVDASLPSHISDLFDDPLLATYLEQLADGNREAQTAAARVHEAYALRQISAAKLYPFVDGRIAFNQSKPAGGVLEGADPGGSAFGQLPLNIKQLTFLADFDLLWELDLFGKRKKEVASAKATIEMEIASYQDLLLSLSAEFARTFLEVRRNQRLLALVNAEISVLEEKNQVTRQRLDQGLDSELSLLDSDIDLDRLRAEVPQLQGEVEALIYRLSRLLGRRPGALWEEMGADASLPRIKGTVAVGFPSELLRRRPDIRYAERQLAKATADVGVATAALFPSLTLTGNYGFQILHLGDAKGSGPSWGYGENLLAPLFHAGSLRANLNRYRWIRKEAMYAYEEAVLVALEEAESSIARFLKSRDVAADKERLSGRSRQLLLHSEERYGSGLTDSLAPLDRRRKAIQAEKEWVDAEVDSETRLITLYKALGGGWSC